VIKLIGVDKLLNVGIGLPTADTMKTFGEINSSIELAVSKVASFFRVTLIFLYFLHSLSVYFFLTVSICVFIFFLFLFPLSFFLHVRFSQWRQEFSTSRFSLRIHVSDSPQFIEFLGVKISKFSSNSPV